MYLPIRALALRDEGVQRPGRRPHDIAPRLVVLGIPNGNLRAVQKRAQQSLREVVRSVVVLPRKILFENVGHDIEKSRNHLIARERKGEFRVENGEFGKDLFPEHVTDLEFLRVVRDDRPAVHLAPRPHHGQNAPDGDHLALRLFKADIVFFPRVLRAMHRYGNRLRVVADRAAPYR